MSRKAFLEETINDLYSALQDDILARYNNSEYWNQDLMDEFLHNEKDLTKKEKENIRKQF